jgi:hypothetical protein
MGIVVRGAQITRNALTTFEAFKVYGGQIHAVEAFIRIMSAGTPSGWNYEVQRPK